MDDYTKKAFEDLLQFLLEKHPAVLVEYQNALLADAQLKVDDLRDEQIELKAKIENLERDLEIAREEIDRLTPEPMPEWERELLGEVETNERRFKVGDEVSGTDYALLPIGTRVQNPWDDRREHVKIEGGWKFAPGEYVHSDSGLASPRKIVHLPTSYVNGV